MSEYKSPIVEGLNSDVGASRGTAAIGETFFASQFYMAAGVAVIVLYLAAFTLPVRTVGECDEPIPANSN